MAEASIPSERTSRTAQAGFPRIPGDRGRMLRGVELYRTRHAEFSHYLDGTIGVPSKSEADLVYHVDLDARGGRGTCECQDHVQRLSTCMHIYAAMIYRAKRAMKLRRGSGPRSRCERPARGYRRRAAA